MDDRTWLARMASGNPLHPYTWVAEYQDAAFGFGPPGGRLKQFDVDGYHTSRHIDRVRLKRLLILNHPRSPIDLPVPHGPPDEVVMRARVDLEMDLGGTIVGRKVSCFFGYKYGEDQFLLEIDDEGKLHKTNKD